MRRQSPAQKHCLTLLLLAITLMLTNVVPTGWMPAKGVDGQFVVRICSQGLTEAQRIRLETLAQAQIKHAMHGADHHSDDDHKAISDPCPYGVVANSFAVPPSPSPLAESLVAVLADQPYPYSNVGIGKGLAAPPPPSTGPPVFS